MASKGLKQKQRASLRKDCDSAHNFSDRFAFAENRLDLTSLLKSYDECLYRVGNKDKGSVL